MFPSVVAKETIASTIFVNHGNYEDLINRICLNTKYKIHFKRNCSKNKIDQKGWGVGVDLGEKQTVFFKTFIKQIYFISSIVQCRRLSGIPSIWNVIKYISLCHCIFTILCETYTLAEKITGRPK